MIFNSTEEQFQQPPEMHQALTRKLWRWNFFMSWRCLALQPRTWLHFAEGSGGTFLISSPIFQIRYTTLWGVARSSSASISWWFAEAATDVTRAAISNGNSRFISSLALASNVGKTVCLLSEHRISLQKVCCRFAEIHCYEWKIWSSCWTLSKGLWLCRYSF